MTKSRILLVDIETAPSLGWVWGKWEQNVIDFKRDWFLLSFAYKWLGERGVHGSALIDYATFAGDKEDDRLLTKDLWNLFDEADIIVAHNGDNFDVKKANTRFISHQLPPPTPYKTVDTRKLARKYFRFDCNKLDSLGRYLGLGRKLPNTGFDLWKRCMDGDRAAWSMMMRYNKRDIVLLEKVYLKLLGWANTHPSVAQGEAVCPKCASGRVQKRGFAYTLARKKQRLQCLDCRGWWEGKVSDGAKG